MVSASQLRAFLAERPSISVHSLEVEMGYSYYANNLANCLKKNKLSKPIQKKLLPLMLKYGYKPKF